MVLAPYHVHYEADDHVGRDDFELFKEQTQNQIDNLKKEARRRDYKIPLIVILLVVLCVAHAKADVVGCVFRVFS